MKRRLLTIFFIPLLVFSVVLPLYTPSGKVSAASDVDLAYDYDADNIAAMNSAAGASKDDSSFAASVVLAKGGIFGDGALFKYARYVNDSGYQYTHDYYCVNGVAQAQKPATGAYDQLELSVWMYEDSSLGSAGSYKNLNNVGIGNGYYSGLTHFTQYDSKGNKGFDIGSDTVQNDGTNGGETWNGLIASNDGNGKYDIGVVGGGGSSLTTIQNTSCMNPFNQITNSGDMVNLPNASQSVQNDWDNAIKTTSASTVVTAAGSGSGSGGSGTGGNSPSLSCSVSGISILNPLNWLLCGAIEGMSDIIGVVDNAITSQLSVGNSTGTGVPNQIFCSNKQTCQSYHKAWESFRDIALGLLVLVGLIILIAQALGLEVLDAYTIRRTLPRLLIASIAITLSWQLMEFFVELTNDLGYGVRSLIYYPFTSGCRVTGATSSCLGNATISINSFTANGASLLGLMGGIALGAFGLLTLAAAGALALLVAFFVLVLRQIAIIVLIIAAPVALLAYILPNTQNIFKIWWDSFSRALLMFPLIAGFIAAGHVFSAVAISNATGSGSNKVIYDFAAFAAYFAPYFLIPATFRLAGGAVRQIGGFVNDRSRGGFDRLRNARNQRISDNVKRSRSGNRWNDDYLRFKNPFTGKQTSLGHIGNRMALNLFDQDELATVRVGNTKYGKHIMGRGAARIQNQFDDKILEDSTKGVQKLQQLGFGREAYQGIAGDWHGLKGQLTEDYKGYRAGTAVSAVLEAEGRKMPKGSASSLADFDLLSDIMTRSTDAQVVEGGDKIRANRGYLATVRSDIETPLADTQAMGFMGMMASGYGGTAEDVANVANSMMRKDRLGHAGLQVMDQGLNYGRQSRPDLRDRYGFTAQRNAEGEVVYSSAFKTDMYGKQATSAIITTKGTDWTPAKGEAVRDSSETIKGLVSGAAVEHWEQQAQQHTAAGNTTAATEATKYANDLRAQQANIKNLVAYGAANVYSDSGSQAEWQKIYNDLKGANLMTDEDLRLGQSRVQDDNANNLRTGAGNAPTPPGPPAPGGAPTGP